MTVTESSGINVSPERLREIYDQIEEIDTQLAAATGSDSLGKRAYLNRLAAEVITNPDVEKFVASAVSQLSALADSPEVLAGVITAMEKSLNDQFGKQVDEFAAKYVEENKQDTVQVSEEQIASMTSQTRDLRKMYAGMRNVLEMVGIDVSNVPEPKKMTGARGKRGPRTLSGFHYLVDDKDRTDSQDNLSSIANTVFAGTEFGVTKALREELARQGLDLQNPPDNWSYTVVAGDKSVKISAVKVAETEVDDSSDDSEGVEEEENEEVTEPVE